MYDIIGDIHGCHEELTLLINKLGYQWENGIPLHSSKRKLIFLGDLTDRGPNSIDVITLVYHLVQSGAAFYTPGNHCNKLYRYFLGNRVQIKHGLETTDAELKRLPPKKQREIKQKFMKLYKQAPLYLTLDDGKLIVAHAGIPEKYIGQNNEAVKTFVLYGDITGGKHPDGTPIRLDWAKYYQGEQLIVYGHTPVKEVRIINNTYNIDTGAVFGGKLSALRYPEIEIVDVPSTLPLVAEKFNSFNP